MSEEADKAAPAVDAGVKPASKRSSAPKPRKSGGGSKKAAQDTAKHEFGDIVLARLRGFPPWPARITDPENLPPNVLSLRPKNPAIQCAQFFPVGDYSWLAPKDIQPLKRHQIQAFLDGGHRKAAGNLREAYETALDPSEWDQAQEEYRREKEQAEAEAEEDVDELEEEEQEDGEEQAAKGKRKRSAPAPKKEAKKAKVSKKAEDKPKSKADKPKSKANDKAEAAAEETKSEGAPAASGEDADPEAIKVKDWRHKLQRAFLQKGVPTSSEMEQFDDLFKTIENYGDMKIEYLQYSKIGKVMKKIAALTNVPRDDEFKITSRAEKLMKEWTDFINRSEGGGAAANGSADKAEKATSTSPANNDAAAQPAPAAPAVEEAPAVDAPAPDESAAPDTEEIKVDA